MEVSIIVKFFLGLSFVHQILTFSHNRDPSTEEMDGIPLKEVAEYHDFNKNQHIVVLIDENTFNNKDIVRKVESALSYEETPRHVYYQQDPIPYHYDTYGCVSNAGATSKTIEGYHDYITQQVNSESCECKICEKQNSDLNKNCVSSSCDENICTSTQSSNILVGESVTKENVRTIEIESPDIVGSIHIPSKVTETNDDIEIKSQPAGVSSASVKINAGANETLNITNNNNSAKAIITEVNKSAVIESVKSSQDNSKNNFDEKHVLVGIELSKPTKVQETNIKNVSQHNLIPSEISERNDNKENVVQPNAREEHTLMGLETKPSEINENTVNNIGLEMVISGPGVSNIKEIKDITIQNAVTENVLMGIEAPKLTEVNPNIGKKSDAEHDLASVNLVNIENSELALLNKETLIVGFEESKLNEIKENTVQFLDTKHPVVEIERAQLSEIKDSPTKHIADEGKVLPIKVDENRDKNIGDGPVMVGFEVPKLTEIKNNPVVEIKNQLDEESKTKEITLETSNVVEEFITIPKDSTSNTNFNNPEIETQIQAPVASPTTNTNNLSENTKIETQIPAPELSKINTNNLIENKLNQQNINNQNDNDDIIIKLPNVMNIKGGPTKFTVEVTKSGKNSNVVVNKKQILEPEYKSSDMGEYKEKKPATEYKPISIPKNGEAVITEVKDINIKGEIDPIMPFHNNNLSNDDIKKNLLNDNFKNVKNINMIDNTNDKNLNLDSKFVSGDKTVLENNKIGNLLKSQNPYLDIEKVNGVVQPQSSDNGSDVKNLQSGDSQASLLNNDKESNNENNGEGEGVEHEDYKVLKMKLNNQNDNENREKQDQIDNVGLAVSRSNDEIVEENLEHTEFNNHVAIKINLEDTDENQENIEHDNQEKTDVDKNVAATLSQRDEESENPENTKFNTDAGLIINLEDFDHNIDNNEEDGKQVTLIDNTEKINNDPKNSFDKNLNSEIKNEDETLSDKIKFNPSEALNIDEFIQSNEKLKLMVDKLREKSNKNLEIISISEIEENQKNDGNDVSKANNNEMKIETPLDSEIKDINSKISDSKEIVFGSPTEVVENKTSILNETSKEETSKTENGIVLENIEVNEKDEVGIVKNEKIENLEIKPASLQDKTDSLPEQTSATKIPEYTIEDKESEKLATDVANKGIDTINVDTNNIEDLEMKPRVMLSDVVTLKTEEKPVSQINPNPVLEETKINLNQNQNSEIENKNNENLNFGINKNDNQIKDETKKSENKVLLDNANLKKDDIESLKKVENLEIETTNKQDKSDSFSKSLVELPEQTVNKTEKPETGSENKESEKISTGMSTNKNQNLEIDPKASLTNVDNLKTEENTVALINPNPILEETKLNLNENHNSELKSKNNENMDIDKNKNDSVTKPNTENNISNVNKDENSTIDTQTLPKEQNEIKEENNDYINSVIGNLNNKVLQVNTISDDKNIVETVDSHIKTLIDTIGNSKIEEVDSKSKLPPNEPSKQNINSIGDVQARKEVEEVIPVTPKLRRRKRSTSSSASSSDVSSPEESASPETEYFRSTDNTSQYYSDESTGESSSQSNSDESTGEASSQSSSDSSTGEVSSQSNSDESTEEASSQSSSDESTGEASSQSSSNKSTEEASSQSNSDESTEEASLQSNSDESTSEVSSQSSSDESTGEASSKSNSDESISGASSQSNSDESTEEASSQSNSNESTEETSSQSYSDESTGEASSQSNSDESTAEASSESNSDESTTEASSQFRSDESTGEVSSQSNSDESTAEASSQYNSHESTSEASSQSNSNESTEEVSSQSNSDESTEEASSQSNSYESTEEASSQSYSDESTGEASSQSSSDESTREVSSQSSSDESTGEASSQSSSDESTREVSSQSSSDESTGETSSQSNSDESTREASSQSNSDESTGQASSQSISDESIGEASSQSISDESTGEASSQSNSDESTGEASSQSNSNENTGEASSQSISDESTGEASSQSNSDESTGEASSQSISDKSTGKASSQSYSNESTGEASSQSISDESTGEASSQSSSDESTGEVSSHSSSDESTGEVSSLPECNDSTGELSSIYCSEENTVETSSISNSDQSMLVTCMKKKSTIDPFEQLRKFNLDKFKLPKNCPCCSKISKNKKKFYSKKSAEEDDCNPKTVCPYCMTVYCYKDTLCLCYENKLIMKDSLSNDGSISSSSFSSFELYESDSSSSSSIFSNEQLSSSRFSSELETPPCNDLSSSEFSSFEWSKGSSSSSEISDSSSYE